MSHINGGVRGALITTLQSSAPGVWNINEAAARLRHPITSEIDNVWPQASDPSFSSVQSLVHFNQLKSGAAAGTTAQYYDSSNNGFHLTTQGNVTNTGPSTFTKWGGYTKGIGSALSTCTYDTTTGRAAYQMGNGDFTIELWCYFNSVTVATNLVDMRTTAIQVAPVIYFTTAGSLRYFVNNADRITGANSQVTTGTWFHIACSRVSGNTYLYLNGTQQGSTYVDGNNYNAGGALYINGVFNNTSTVASLHHQDFRLTKGVGRYSGATCTVPTAPFPDY